MGFILLNQVFPFVYNVSLPLLHLPDLKVPLKRILLFCFSNLDTSELCGMYITLYDLHVNIFFKISTVTISSINLEEVLTFSKKMNDVCLSKLVRRSAVSTRNTRNSQLLDIPLFRTASSQRTFQYRATSLWNELQPALKLSPSVMAFKHLLRQKLLYDCFT